jgi:prophage regulatory protein
MSKPASTCTPVRIRRAVRAVEVDTIPPFLHDEWAALPSSALSEPKCNYQSPASQVGGEPMRVLRMHEVQDRVPFSRSSIYLLIAQGRFPRPIALGRRAVGWLESDVDAWIASRVQLRDWSQATQAEHQHA